MFRIAVKRVISQTYNTTTTKCIIFIFRILVVCDYSLISSFTHSPMFSRKTPELRTYKTEKFLCEKEQEFLKKRKQAVKEEIKKLFNDAIHEKVTYFKIDYCTCEKNEVG